MTDKKDKLLSEALKAICLTRDYVGEDLLPPIKGWTWYDAGMAICEEIPDDEWAEQFRLRLVKRPPKEPSVSETACSNG